MRHRRPFLGRGPVPDLGPAERAPFLVDLRRSGELGVPLTALRRLQVLPAPPPEPQAPVAPAVDLPRLYPWLFPPREGTYPIVRANAPAIVAAGATLDVVFIGAASLSGLDEVPRGYRGVVQRLGQNAADFTNLTWTVLIKARPADPIIALAFQFAALNDALPLPGAGIPLEPGDDLVVRVTNTGLAAVGGVRARLDLYLWRT